MATSQDEYYRGLERAAAAASHHGDPTARAVAVHEAITPLLVDTDSAAELACRTGCDHCCHFPVGVTFAEAVRLADAIRGDDALTRRVLDEARSTATHSWHQLVGRPCPLLSNGSCTRYAARPIPCRALASRDADACERALAGPATVPRDEQAWWRGLGAVAALAEGPPPGSRELRSAVAAILTESGTAAAFVAARQVGQGDQ